MNVLHHYEKYLAVAGVGDAITNVGLGLFVNERKKKSTAAASKQHKRFSGIPEIIGTNCYKWMCIIRNKEPFDAKRISRLKRT